MYLILACAAFDRNRDVLLCVTLRMPTWPVRTEYVFSYIVMIFLALG